MDRAYFPHRGNKRIEKFYLLRLQNLAKLKSQDSLEKTAKKNTVGYFLKMMWFKGQRQKLPVQFIHNTA